MMMSAMMMVNDDHNYDEYSVNENSIALNELPPPHISLQFG